ncbi:hypothetical protein A152_0012620 [Vibrio tasmaniensis 1F-187]|uniref:hypothetical protein n=1 Tax=unclassified Vibrio TaxID=2614977 RepID=UPI0002F1A242|nr:hypothetical protein [Vibrio tasmaniensis]OEF72319.1 hypothetical protein A152_01350 [Vibrio tasmaniensis 1F-187]
MDLIKNYTVFANGEQVKHKCKNGDWISRYALDSVNLKDELSNETIPFIPEENKKLTKRLAEYGYKTNGKGQRLAKRITKLLKETGTAKKDWSHIVYPTESGIDVWLTNLEYLSFDKVMHGDVVLFRMIEKTKQVEVIKYTDTIQEHRKTTIDGRLYFTPTERKGGGRYHSFNKKDGNKPFVWKLELMKNENRGWKLGKLRQDATLDENTVKTNEIVDVVNSQVDELEILRQEIAALKAQLKVA